MRASVLITLIVYLAAMLTLTTTLPAIWAMAREATRTSHAAMADAVAGRLEDVPPADAAGYDREVRRLQATYPILTIGEPAAAAGTARSDEVHVRTIHGRRVAIRFAPNQKSDNLMRRGLFAATAAALAGLTLLGIAGFDFLMLLSNLRGRGSSGASAESSSMIATFETSIQAMKGREKELRVLHDRARDRAAELATISSTLVRSLTSGFIALDEEGRILDVNLAARELMRDDIAVTGSKPMAAIHRPRFAEALQRAADAREVYQRHEVTEEDGAVFGLTTVPLLDDGGRYFGMLALFADLTPVRKLEARMREIQSLADLGELSAGIAHEFRNSLSTILGYLRLAQKPDVTPPRLGETLTRAEAEAKDLSAAVDSLLTFARPLPLQKQEVDLSDVMRALVDRMLPDTAGGASVQVTTHFEPANVSADPALLSRALENLLRNAWESIGEKGVDGEIRVEVRAEPHPRVLIHDTGIGLDPSQAARLFLPFQSTKANGFGVGLALTRKIVLLHGGSVSLKGEKGQGATAEVELPRVVAGL
jgi:signal transduction histidine kinase